MGGRPGIVLSEARHIKMADIMQILGIFKQFKFGLLSVSIRLKLTPFAGVSPSLSVFVSVSLLLVSWLHLCRSCSGIGCQRSQVLSLLRAAI